MASIAIVGGGIAGLACAWRLSRAGHDVEVLEREASLGGRLAGVSAGGFSIEHGASAIGPFASTLRAVGRELGLTLGVWARSPDGWLADGALATWPAGRFGWLYPPGVSTALRGSALWRLPRLVRGAALAGRGAFPGKRLDASTLAGLLGGSSSRLGDRLTPLLRAAIGVGSDEVSAAAAALALGDLAPGARLESFVAGSGRLCDALAAGVSVRTDCQVVAVETETDGARVRYRVGERESRTLADAVVVAVPGDRVASLCPKLTPEERGFFEGLRYLPATVVSLLCERAPKSLLFRRLWFSNGEGGDLAELRAEHLRPGAAPHGAGLLRATLTPDATRRLWEASDATLADTVLESLAYTPVGVIRPRRFGVRRWASAFPGLPPGAYAARARFDRRVDRTPRLAFAGDYRRGASLEAALCSGLDAASEITRGL